MAGTKNTSKVGKAKKQKSINKWAILAGVALVAIVGVVVVRYSGASGEVWSARSSRVAHVGGQVSTKANGSVYWIGTKLHDRIMITTPSKGSYCIKGSFQANGARATIYYYDSKGTYHGFDSVSGKKGQTFNACHSLPAAAQYTAAVYYSSGSSTGPIVVNRFEKQ